MKSGEAKLFTAILLGAVILVAVCLYPVLMAKEQRPNEPPKPVDVPFTREEAIPPGSHVVGNPKAPYLLVEFGDFQCDLCFSSSFLT